MSGTYTNLNFHIVFSTKERRQLITSAIEAELFNYIGGIVRNLEGKLLEANGMPDHIHLLVKLKPKVALSGIVRDIKANSTNATARCTSSPGKTASRHSPSANRSSRA